MFDFEGRGEDEEEDGGHRSILGLEEIGFSGARKAAAGAVPEPAPVRRPAAPDLELTPDREEPSDRRSILGLERIELAPEWRARVAANTSAELIASRETVERRGPSARDEEEDSGHPSILGLERIRFVPRPGAAVAGGAPSDPIASRQPVAPREPAPSRGRLPPRDLLSLREPLAPSEIDPPQFERELEPRPVQPIPVERAILFSLALHIIVFLLLRWAPAGGTVDPRRGLLAGLIPAPEEMVDKVPIVFRSAPGPERENPKRSDLSDKTRRAGGGDPSQSRSETPLVPQRPGIEGLAPGAGRKTRSAPPPRPASRDSGQASAAASSPADRAKAAPDTFAVPRGAGPSAGEGPKLADLQKAIQDAAREVGSSGEGGAGTPNPEGGFVDSGPISFDTTWYDWGAYAEEMVRRIKLHWEIPELARLGWKGRLTIRFFILADGRVADAKIVARSGVPPFDFAALQAIIKSDPFRPLPRDLLAQVPGKDREGITVTFFYNLRSEKE